MIKFPLLWNFYSFCKIGQTDIAHLWGFSRNTHTTHTHNIHSHNRHRRSHSSTNTHTHRLSFTHSLTHSLTNENKTDALAFQPYFSLTASNVLFGYWSHDIVGPHDDHELHTRWVQWCVFACVCVCVLCMCMCVVRGMVLRVVVKIHMVCACVCVRVRMRMRVRVCVHVVVCAMCVAWCALCCVLLIRACVLCLSWCDLILYFRASVSGAFRTHDRGMSAGGCANNNPSTCAIVRIWDVPTKVCCLCLCVRVCV